MSAKYSPLHLTPELSKLWDTDTYPFLAYNSTTGKLYAYTHMPEWSGVEHNFFKVEGKQKRIPYRPFSSYVKEGVVYTCYTPSQSIFEQVERAMVSKPVSYTENLAELQRKFDELRKELDILIAPKPAPTPAPTQDFRILPISKAQRELMGIPTGASHLVLFNNIPHAASVPLVDDTYVLTILKPMPHLHMGHYRKISLVDWN